MTAAGLPELLDVVAQRLVPSVLRLARRSRSCEHHEKGSPWRCRHLTQAFLIALVGSSTN